MENPSTSTFGFVNDGNLIFDDTQDSDSEEEVDIDNPCPICLGPCTKSGLHMATRLKCGHKFGFSCINRWVKRAQCCPLCKRVNYKRHMRGVYQRLENRWDRAPTAEELAARDRRRLRQAHKRTLRRAIRRMERHAAEAELAASEDGQGDDVFGTAASGSYRTDSDTDNFNWEVYHRELAALEDGQRDNDLGTAASCSYRTDSE